MSDYYVFVKIHDWRVRTETGENRLWRATKHGGRWSFLSRLQRSEEEWTKHEDMGLEDLQKAREVLFNKYQRRRLPWEDVVQIDAMIEELQEAGGDVEPPRELSGESRQ